MLSFPLMRKLVLSACCAFVVGSATIAQQGSVYWNAVGESEARVLSQDAAIFPATFKPVAFNFFRLNHAALGQALSGAPIEQQQPVALSEKIISIPGPDGALQRFRIVQTTVMEPGLAAKYPGIKAFIGKGIDNPSAVLRFDYNSRSFHGMVSAPGKPTYYINPVDKTPGLYVINARNPLDKVTQFQCTLEKTALDQDEILKGSELFGNADDSKLREFRLALCVNGEFSQYWLDGSEADTAEMKMKVMEALVVCIVRANEVYERDLGTRLIYVENQDTLIFIDPNTDPWPKNPPIFGSSWNTKTQQTIDARIGDDNYDIGHLLGKVSSFDLNNGNAGCIACVCINGDKGSGFSAYFEPGFIDYMVIDYWTHEMGHQFGANHTFTFQKETGSQAQIEPGSGSTIMGYAGITGPTTDIQPHSDDLFSTASIAQITSYIKLQAGNPGCATVTGTGNTTPVANAGSDYVIPRSTPFKLTGTGSDADATDAPSYIWEQTDFWDGAIVNRIPQPTSLQGPLFRTYNYTSSTEKYFPELSTVLAGQLGTKWEALPSVARELNFRFTVRDNHPGGGNNHSDDILINVDANAGPFAITAPNEAVSWGEGSLQTITWDVANTNAATVNCATVKILLSIDGGLTFPFVLAEATDNDGSEEITVPFLESSVSTARIKVEAVGNIFYDISNADFSIDGALPVNWVSFTVQKTGATEALLKWSTANEFNNNHFDIERSTDGTTFSKIGTVTSGINKGQVQQYTFADSRVPQGVNYFRIKQVDNDGRFTYSKQHRLLFDKNGLWSATPNPAKDNIRVRFNGDATNIRIELASQAGSVAFNKLKALVRSGEELIIPVSNLANGVYYLTITNAGERKTEKIVVQK